MKTVKSMLISSLKDGASLVIIRDDVETVMNGRGLRPLLELIRMRQGKDCYIGDKIVGRAAAFLYGLVRPKFVYAEVMSDGGLELLKTMDIECDCKNLVRNITNRTKTGSCPMEEAVKDARDPEDAYGRICRKVFKMIEKKATAPVGGVRAGEPPEANRANRT